jgi:hypothetical protein
MKLKNHIVLFTGYFALITVMWAQERNYEISDAEVREELMLVKEVNHSTLAYRAAVIQQMLNEANYFSERLKLSTPHPIQMTDVRYPLITPPWFSVVQGTNFVHFFYSTNTPREQRLRALKIGASGTIDIRTNFVFCFSEGKLREVTRLSEHDVERYANNLDALVSKPSLIDTNGAYQLATQWLAAVDIDMTALNKLKWKVNQLHYLLRGATNTITLPIYYVDFGNKHYTASGNLHAFDEPLIQVEILGTTKELQDLTINDLSLSRRLLLLITNALDLIRTPNPTVRQLQNPATARAYALTPTEVSNYSKNFQSSPLFHTNIVQTNSPSP